MKRWRLVTKMEMRRKAKYAVEDSYEEICSEFFNTIFVPKIRDEHPRDEWIMHTAQHNPHQVSFVNAAIYVIQFVI